MYIAKTITGTITLPLISSFITKNLREPWITSGEICGAIVGKGCGKWEEINNWTVDIPEKKLREDELSDEKRVKQNDQVLK